MTSTEDRSARAVAVVGVAAILPDAPGADAFWKNVREGRYSITDVPEDRWVAADYYDPDPAAPDKTYSKIGAWVRGFAFDWKRFHVPPRIADSMDEGQQWAVTVAAQALADYGHPGRALDLDRTGVVLGAAMGGERHYLTCLRISFPEYARELESVEQFAALPLEVRRAIVESWHEKVGRRLPPITEDTMPGELANIISGRVANLLNLRGPNFITDAACASTFAAIDAGMDLLAERQCDAVITGGVDRNMGVSSFVKFCKIGALSATGTRPFGDGADGFVMGEGAAAFLLKRLADAERDGDRIHAVIRGVGGASDGRGKGITAPNPAGQKLAMKEAWADAGLDPATAGLVEAHGTSTRVGDVVEVESLAAVFGGARPGSVALGSVKSNIGHLKGAAGAAGLLKAVFAVRDKVLPPTLHARPANPSIGFEHTPFVLNHELREWPRANGDPRRAGVSAYGFGGTNFHVVVEEHMPGLLTRGSRPSVTSVENAGADRPRGLTARPPLRGLLALGADTDAGLRQSLDRASVRVREGSVPEVAAPEPAVLAARERLMVDFGTPAELVDHLEKAQRAFALGTPAAWKVLEGQGVFRGSGPRRGKLAFLFPGQGSQYLNMGRALCEREPAVAAVFEEADRVLAPLLGRPLTRWLFVDPADDAQTEAAETALKQTSITQPAVLALDIALARLLATFGIEPDVVMGHSLGEYAALVAAGVMPLADALEAASARGHEMTRVSVEDNGRMAAVMAPLPVVEEVIGALDGYVVAANINSPRQCVIGGATAAVDRAVETFRARGFEAVPLAVSHAFHTRIVAPASGPMRRVLDRLRFSPPSRPIVGNVTGGFYPTGVEAIKDLLEKQIASPVQWLKGLEALHHDGARVFVEVGPKRALKGFVDDVLGDREGTMALFTNHPRTGEIASFNQALAGLYAAGAGAPAEAAAAVVSTGTAAPAVAATAMTTAPPVMPDAVGALAAALTQAIGRLGSVAASRTAYDRNEVPLGSVVISGTGLGLPGTGKPVMDPSNVDRILRGEQMVDLVPAEYRRRLADKHITRVVKSEDGSGRFEPIEDTDDVIKLAGRGGAFDLTAEYGVSEKLVEALDVTAQLAMAAGLDALREAGIPLVQTWRKTTTGRYLPDRWLLPESLRDETGVVFASAFPGLDRFADEMTRFYEYDRRRRERQLLDELRQRTQDAATLDEIARRLAAVDVELAREPYAFDRRFLLRVLAMGHSQFAEYIGARGPNTQVNAACASSPAAVAIAEDWIRAGRCRRVVVIGADNATSPRLFEWIGSGFLATGAAATDDKVEEAALPFDRRRHGTLLGMGASALVVETQDALEERGMRGIVELLSSEVRNSAFHATRLNVAHIAEVVESLVASAERRFGLGRFAMAPQTVFVSHETFTPARGGSASAEVEALRKVFGPAAREIVVANTKGFTGHPMGVGVEDVIAVKILEHGIVPPVPNFKEVDADLGELNLSRGGRYPVRYALHLAAGFGSEIALTLTRRIPGGLERVESRPLYERWLADVTGQDRAATEVVQRVLRVPSPGPPVRVPAPSPWRFGLGPSRRTPGDDVSVAVPVVAALPVAAPPAAPVSKAAPSPAAVPSPAAEPVPKAAPEAAPSAPSRPSGPEEVAAKVLAIVAEKTGYPPEMLEMDLDLEADLGVDTVKQAETFAAVRAAYGIPRQESLKLRDFPTLKHVVGFVLQHRPDLRPAAEVVATPAPAAATPALPLTAANADRFPRRVPVPSVRPTLAHCKRTGVSLDGRRVLVGTDAAGVAAALRARLEADGASVVELDPGCADLDERVRSAIAQAPVHGVFWLPALDPETPLGEMDLAAFREANRVRVKSLSAVMRILYDQVAAPGTFLVSGTRMGGFLGTGPRSAANPLGGAVAGFTRAYRRERPEALVKVVDVETSAAPETVAEALVGEVLGDPGVVEIGYAEGRRFTVTLAERPPAGDVGQPDLVLGKDSVLLVTGAAGGITSAIVANLAAAGGTFYLMDVAPLPPADDQNVKLLRAGRESLKQALIEEERARGQKPLPPAIERRILEVERQEAALRAVESVEAGGGTAVYRTVDLLDAAAVAAAVGEARRRHGRIDVLLHAGGLEISHDLAHKDPAEFARVFDVKADGFFNLLAATADMPVRVCVAFGSIAGRFGNAGQTDYAAANALLASLGSHLRSARPDTRAVTVDWTAWGGIGMATRGSIPKVMEVAGIESLPPEAGIAALRREIAAGAGEVVVAGRLGVLGEEWDETGGLDLAAADAALASRGFVMLGRALAARVQGGLELETTLDPRQQPFLFDHVLEGTPLLPGAMATEAFAEAASLLAPDLAVVAVEEEQFDKPFKFHRGEPATFRLSLWATPDEGELIVNARLTSRIQPRPDSPAVEKEHFRARVRLGARAAEAAPRVAPPTREGLDVGADRIYRVYFHGPSYRVLEAARVEADTAVGLMADGLPPDTAPASAMTLAEPRLVELCFQTAGLWELVQEARLALPHRLGSVRVRARAAEATGRVWAVVRHLPEGGFAAQVVDDAGRVLLDLDGYRTVTLEGSRNLAA
jgi:acyl transferase domain-containing protein/NADP-dependent 3-hydroxy acid dehydrogenase YdfG